VRPNLATAADALAGYELLRWPALSCVDAGCDIFLIDMPVSGHAVECAAEHVELREAVPVELVFHAARNAWYEL
jgi:hypothetical protein